MAITVHKQADSGLLASVRTDLAVFAEWFRTESLLQPTQSLSDDVAAIEEISRTVEQLQLIGAHAVEQKNVSRVGESSQHLALAHSALAPFTQTDNDAGTHRGTEFRDNADYLRCRLRISRSEARRRIRLGAQLLPIMQVNGELTTPPLERLSAAVSRSEVSGRAATMIADAVERTRPLTAPADLEAMEAGLTLQATESDLDMLRVLTRRWEDLLDPDGLEPTTEVLRVRQGVFLRGKRAGLHHIEISATDGQFEQLVTVMNTATNPRRHVDAPSGSPGSATGPDDPTREQLMLDGLVGACRIALSADKLPATGGHRPQVMVTINKTDLVSDLGRAGHAVFTGPISARSIRQLACDADIIPVVLGGAGQILDIGRSRRLFTPFIRKGLVARDGGCTFPDCAIPASWCEAHHINPWEHGGATSCDNGCLLCTRHHHLIHQGDWKIQTIDGRPWFIPPRYVDARQAPRQNHYHRAGLGPSATGRSA